MSTGLLPLFIGSDNRIRWEGLKDSRDDTYVSNATVTFTLKTSAGVVIVSNVAMPYESGHDGRYQGLLLAVYTIALTLGQRCILEVTATRSTWKDFRRVECEAQYRGAD